MEQGRASAKKFPLNKWITSFDQYLQIHKESGELMRLLLALKELAL